MESNPSSSSRTDRKTIERNRRNQMKVLYSKLNSLLPQETSRDRTSLPDQLQEATSYIKKLQVNVERMKEKKDRLMVGMERLGSAGSSSGNGSNRIDVHVTGSILQVVLVTGLDSQSMFNEILRLIHEEGAEIVNASFSVVDDNTVLHTIHAQVDQSELGHGHHKAARISERLKKFVHDADHGAF